MPRTRQPVDYRLLNKVSRYYYESDLSEEQIATRLHLSRSKVSRILKQAREVGVIQISIISPSGICPDLEQQLEERFNLREAYVVDVFDPGSQESVTRALGAAAAHHLQDTMREGDVIGFSWGSTLSAMALSIRPQKYMDNHVVQLIGGLGPPNSESHATGLCRRVAIFLNCDVTLLPAPGIMANQQAKEAVLMDTYVRNAIDMFSRVNLAYVGIGTPSPNSVVLRDGSIISFSQLEKIKAQGGVGDIALRFYDAQGKPIHSPVDDLVIGITLEELKNIDTVVGVSGGPEKVTSVKAALLGGYINVLVTDQLTAQRIIE